MGGGQSGQEVLVVDGRGGRLKTLAHRIHELTPEAGPGAVGLGEAVDQGLDPPGPPSPGVGREIPGEEAACAEDGCRRVGQVPPAEVVDVGERLAAIAGLGPGPAEGLGKLTPCENMPRGVAAEQGGQIK